MYILYIYTYRLASYCTYIYIVLLIDRSKGKPSEYDRWSRAQTPNPDFFDSHNDQLESYEMSGFDESDEEACDEVDGVSETCFDNPQAVELELSGRSLDTITSTQSAPSAINIGDDRKIPLQPSSLPTVEEISEDPLPPTDDMNEPHKSYEQLLSPSPPMQSLNTRTINRKTTISSSSLPVNGVATMKQHSEVKEPSSVTPKPLLHTATSSTLIPNSSDGNVRKTDVPTSARKRKQDTLTRRRTHQDFSSQSVARRPNKLPIRRGSRFHSKFLNDNEDHVIWKPDKSPHNVTTTSDPIKKKVSTSTMTPGIDYGVGQSKSWDHPDGADGISPISEDSPLTTFSDFRLRQQQLLQRVTIAREVGKNQNNKLYMPEMSEEDKKRTLKLASRYVSYRLSKKPVAMGDVVLQAMASNKPTSPADGGQPITVKEKWQKAVLMSRHTPEMKRPSMASLRSNRSELQLVKINTLGQRSSNPRYPHISDIKQSYSDQELSKIGKDSPPKTRPPLKSRATAMGITTSGLEDVVEVDVEREATVGTGSVDNDPSSKVNNKPHGHGWSGSLHAYDNPIARFSQLYLSGSSSTMGDGSLSSLQDMGHSNPTIVLSKAKSSSTRDLCSAATMEEGLSHVQLRQSRSYGSLSRPVSLDKAVRVPDSYQFQQEEDASVQDQPNSMAPMASGMDSVGSPETQSNKQPVSPQTEPDSFSPRVSSEAIVSTSSVIARMIPAEDHVIPGDAHNDKAAVVLSPSHEQGGNPVTSTSMYAGRQEHHHSEKSPTSSSVFI